MPKAGMKTEDCWGGSRGGSGGSVEPRKLEPLTSNKL